MKKIVVSLLIGALALGVIACGRGEKDDVQNSSSETQNGQTQNSQMQESQEIESQPSTTEQVELNIANAKDILSKLWDSYPEEERFSVVGGHYSGYVDGAPAEYDITKKEDLESVFKIPQADVEMIDDAASLLHAMNVNNFAAIAYHLVDGADIDKLVSDIKEGTMNSHWLCGQPERLAIFTIGDEYVVSAYGSGENIDNFVTKMRALYDNAPELVVDEDL